MSELSLPPSRKVIQMAEEILYTLVARVVGAQSLIVIPGRPRGTGARRGYARSKAKGKHKLLTGHGTGSYRYQRLHRQNVDCDISITHLGGGLDDLKSRVSSGHSLHLRAQALKLYCYDTGWKHLLYVKF